MLSAEDSLADVIRPRLEACGADLEKVHVVESVADESGRERGFDLQADIAKLRKLSERIGGVALIVIDPITSYMGTKIDSHRTTDVRSVLQPLARFAEETGVAVLAISHPPKAAQAKAINSATGSLAFVAAARMFFVTATEHETKRRLLLPVKNNLAALSNGVGYGIAQRVVSKGIVAPYIAWDGAPVTMTADEAMRPSGSGAKLSNAKDLLREMLADGPVSAAEVEAAAERDGIRPGTLRRARKELRIVSDKDGYQGQWVLKLPAVGKALN
jgi:putative DNA primase/helicase